MCKPKNVFETDQDVMDYKICPDLEQSSVQIEGCLYLRVHNTTGHRAYDVRLGEGDDRVSRCIGYPPDMTLERAKAISQVEAKCYEERNNYTPQERKMFIEEPDEAGNFVVNYESILVTILHYLNKLTKGGTLALLNGIDWGDNRINARIVYMLVRTVELEQTVQLLKARAKETMAKRVAKIAEDERDTSHSEDPVSVYYASILDGRGGTYQ